MSQLEMFAAPAAKHPEMPTADDVRPRLEAVLRELRQGSTSGWSDAERRRWFVVFPQMCAWLPDEERDAKRKEFNDLWPDEVN